MDPQGISNNIRSCQVARYYHLYRPDQPPTEVPFNVGGALTQFIPLDSCLPNTPAGVLKSFQRRQRNDFLSSPLPFYSIPSDDQCHEIIIFHASEADIQAIHFLPPHIIGESDMTSSKRYARHSLPSRVGGMMVQHHDAQQKFRKGSSQRRYVRLITSI